MAATPDGGALATAGPSSFDWNVHRITPTADGGTATEKVARIQADPIRVEGLALAGGELFLDGRQGTGHRLYGFALDAAGRPAGPQTRRSPGLAGPTCLTGDSARPQPEALGDGRVAHLFTDSAGHEYVIETGLDTGSLPSVPTGDARGRIAGGTGRYVLYNGGTPGVQKIADSRAAPRPARSRSAATAPPPPSGSRPCGRPAAPRGRSPAAICGALTGTRTLR